MVELEVEVEPEDDAESEYDGSEHIYLGYQSEEDYRLRREEDVRLRMEEQLEQSEEIALERSEDINEAFLRSEQERDDFLGGQIRDNRRRNAELERQREQIDIQDDIIQSLYEHQEGDPIDENYYDNGNDQANGEAPSVEYISEQLVARGVTIDDLVSSTLRTNSAYYRSAADHERINAVITKHICEIVFEYILRPQLTHQHSAVEVISNDPFEQEV